MRWPTGLDRKPKHAKAFYATIAVATLMGVGLNFTPINPIRALYWSADINGVVALPIMAMMMLMSAQPRIMVIKPSVARFRCSAGFRRR